jgi:hypothetical protein
MAWVIPAQELVRLSRARIEGGDFVSGLQLRADLEVFRQALGRMGEKVPLACKGYLLLKRVPILIPCQDRRLLLLEDAIKMELEPMLGNPNGSAISEISLNGVPQPGAFGDGTAAE